MNKGGCDNDSDGGDIDISKEHSSTIWQNSWDNSYVDYNNEDSDVSLSDCQCNDVNECVDSRLYYVDTDDHIEGLQVSADTNMILPPFMPSSC